ncbi:MAG: NAD(P)H-dependent glycerol-3-phosphate dehydrogenase [Gammaproteobacteria bacterium]
MKPIIVIGSGSWGSALAILLANNQQAVRLWGIEEAELTEAKKTRYYETYLPVIRLPDQLEIETNLKKAMEDSGDILIVVPSHVLRPAIKNLLPYLHNDSRFILASKGFDPSTGQLLTQVIEEVCGKPIPMAVVSGASFAKEVAMGVPTAIAVASKDEFFAEEVMGYFNSPVCFPEKTTDVVGVQVGGGVKNVMAIAVGIADGLGYGANTRCALITRGLAEMMRLGVALGAREQTFMGISGMGDLILTCTDNLSRNRRFGLAIGQGKTESEALAEIKQVVEGISNVELVRRLSHKHQIKMPIVEQVYCMIRENADPRKAIAKIFED